MLLPTSPVFINVWTAGMTPAAAAAPKSPTTPEPGNLIPLGNSDGWLVGDTPLPPIRTCSTVPSGRVTNWEGMA